MTLPRFLIVGAPRCGTTYLAENLQLHPDIFIPNQYVELGSGDLHFFDLNTEKGRANYEKGLSWYEGLFSECEKHQLPGEKTADYLCFETCAELIRETLGQQTKILVLVRDPVTRAYSHYLHSRHRLPIGLSFSKVVETRVDPADAPVLSSGLYFRHLKPYLEHFGAGNVQVIVNDDLSANPQGELDRICRFLGIRDGFSFHFAKARINQSSGGVIPHFSARIGRWLSRNAPAVYNWILNGSVSSSAKQVILRLRGKSETSEHVPEQSLTVISEKDQKRLRDYYQEDVEDLSSLLNRDLSRLWWNQ